MPCSHRHALRRILCVAFTLTPTDTCPGPRHGMRSRDAAISISATMRAVAKTAGNWSLGDRRSADARSDSATTTDAVSIDHRRVASFAPGEGFEYIRAGWDLDQNLNLYIETAHRVNDRGAVFTWTGHGTSHEGFEAEWRGVTVMTVDGEMVSRMEVLDEGNLDAALATFDHVPAHPQGRSHRAHSCLSTRHIGLWSGACPWARKPCRFWIA